MFFELTFDKKSRSLDLHVLKSLFLLVFFLMNNLTTNNNFVFRF